MQGKLPTSWEELRDSYSLVPEAEKVERILSALERAVNDTNDIAAEIRFIEGREK